MRTKLIREALDTLNNLNEDSRVRRRLLDEDLKGYFKNNYMKVFGDIPAEPADAKKKAEKSAYEKALNVARLDPTFKGRDIQDPEQALNKDKGSYFDWLIRLIKKGKVSYENMMSNKDTFIDVLAHFDDLKKRNRLPADKKDIMQFKDTDELNVLINSLGGDIDTEQAESTTFKGVIKNIRGALQAVCGFKNNEIPEEIKDTEDCLTLICENSKWELWQINSIWGAMLADTYGIDWGAGATWCTGGQYLRGDSPRKGMELYNSANQHYPGYTRNGNVLYFFQQKDNTVARPWDKFQFTLINGYTVDSFFHANDHPAGLDNQGKVTCDRSSYNTAEVMAAFIQQEGLLDAMKSSALRGIEPIIDAENRVRLEQGEPYMYTGGKIKDSFKNLIKNIVFEYDGKQYEVNAKEKPNYLNASSVNEMYNMIQLDAGEPYLYDGTPISNVLRPMIQTVIVAGPDKYQNQENQLNMARRNSPNELPENALLLPTGAFRGCENLTEVKLPVEMVAFFHNAFVGMPEDVRFIIPRYPNRALVYNPRDIEWIKSHFYDEQGKPAFEKVPEDENQQ